MARVILLFFFAVIFSGCDRSRETTTGGASSEPKTSFGKAVEGARQLDRQADSRTSELERQAEELGEE